MCVLVLSGVPCARRRQERVVGSTHVNVLHTFEFMCTQTCAQSSESIDAHGPALVTPALMMPLHLCRHPMIPGGLHLSTFVFLSAGVGGCVSMCEDMCLPAHVVVCRCVHAVRDVIRVSRVMSRTHPHALLVGP